MYGETKDGRVDMRLRSCLAILLVSLVVGMALSCLVVVEPAAAGEIASCTPSSGYQGQTIDVTINGSGTNFLDGDRADLGNGISVHSTTYIGPTQVIANITIGGDAEPGGRDVYVGYG